MNAGCEGNCFCCLVVVFFLVIKKAFHAFPKCEASSLTSGQTYTLSLDKGTVKLESSAFVIESKNLFGALQRGRRL